MRFHKQILVEYHIGKWRPNIEINLLYSQQQKTGNVPNVKPAENLLL